MCGIAGIILKKQNTIDLSQSIILMSDALNHRGPDGEGFILSSKNETVPFFNKPNKDFLRTDLNYIPQSHISKATNHNFLAFAHRRLSIIDLTEAGHQPMKSSIGDVWITFNGEIYNYIELKADLKKLGHVFVSETDTEVVLNAYKQWGHKCVEKFNGMWAFCIYDADKNTCFASRDRFGVKPLYYINNPHFFSFASEQKAFIKSGLIKAKINTHALQNYLFNDLLESNTENFFDEIIELWPGTNLFYDISSCKIITESYYHLSQHVTLKNDYLNENELIEKISFVFENAVKIRLRSDVEVGTCLSGGIDSSALALTIAQFSKQPISCFTSVFKNEKFNEEYFADCVVKKINAKHYKTEPSLNGFLDDLDSLIYSQDVPIWDTSTYAQFKVMELAKQSNIKVVLDGQGADELFAGYHHHFLAKWNDFFSKRHFISGLNEIFNSRKTITNPFQFYFKEKLKQNYYFNKNNFSIFFNDSFINKSQIKNPSVYFNDINQQLLSDIYQTRLKSFLKCEDRCSMFHSVESRTPFSDDVDLINLMFSFNGNKKIKNGVSKFLLREALKSKLPSEIYYRYDKKGFETPMQSWMQTIRPQLLSEIKSADFEFVNYNKIQNADLNNSFHNKLLFKLFVLNRWQKMFL